jgi:hypothetical protein
LSLENKDFNKNFNDLISQINWNEISHIEKINFANSMMALEISNKEKEKIKSVVSNRFSTILITMITIGCLFLFEVDIAYMLVVALSLQMLFLLYYQLLEFGLEKLNIKARASVNDNLNKLIKKYPKD